jgi:hypothetical protein
MKKSFVLIHLGNHFFDYINDCISQIKKFNDDDIFLIIDECNKNKITDNNVIIVTTQELPKTKNHIEFDSHNKLDKNYRNGFWKFATERFLYLEDIIEHHKLENVFHLENDNLIFFDTDELVKIFNENYDFATTFDNDSRAVPGIVYIKNLSSIKDLNKFIITHPFKNDMELISDYRNNSNKKINLPILPSNYNLELKSTSGHTTKNPNQYFLNFTYFNSIFDGAALGQFIGGIDQRNVNHSFSTEGFINESTLFNPKNLKIQFVEDNKNRKIPFIEFENKKIKINNLHIHSKNLKKFLS